MAAMELKADADKKGRQDGGTDGGDKAPKAERPFDLTATEWYLNRELTWLEFNRRVFSEACDVRNPLLERLFFLSVIGSNLDEFFMKRIGGLKQQMGAGLARLSVDGRTPQEQVKACYEVVRDLETRKEKIFQSLINILSKKDIRLLKYEALTKVQVAELREHFIHNIYPLLTPQSIDPAHPFPFLSNLSLNILVTVQLPNRPDKTSLTRIKAPVGAGVPRFIKIGDKHHYVLLEDVIAHNLDILLPGVEVVEVEVFRVTRNANTESNEEHAEDLLVMIESELRERRFAPFVRMEALTGINEVHRGYLAAELGLNEQQDVFEVGSMPAMRDLFEIAFLPFPELHDEPHEPLDHAEIRGRRCIFHSIREHGPFLLQHPYESFGNTVERFLREAATDPKVRAIKMTLYRTSGDSKVVDYLVQAAMNGKQVAVVVELKARFDEAANIRWATRMEEAGVHVTYGVVGLKTHSKITLVVRQDFNGIQRYLHIGTGNYHAGTARLYCDLGLLTNDEQIGQDASELFNYLTTGYTPERNYKKLLPSPRHLKKALIAMIERERKLHLAKKPGCIQFKMNALEDVDITRALYEASRDGVKVDLIVRDTCRFRPGLPGLSESARVLGVVGRFLEHTRIYYFQNGGNEEYYIGSADCMQRNLESRVEVVTPIEAPQLRTLLREQLDLQLNDQRQVWEMQPDGRYVQRIPRNQEEQIGCQERLIQQAQKRLKKASKEQRKLGKGRNSR